MYCIPMCTKHLRHPKLKAEKEPCFIVINPILSRIPPLSVTLSLSLSLTIFPPNFPTVKEPIRHIELRRCCLAFLRSLFCACHTVNSSDTTFFTAGLFDGANGVGRHFSISYQSIDFTNLTDPDTLETTENFRTINANNNWLRCKV